MFSLELYCDTNPPIDANGLRASYSLTSFLRAVKIEGVETLRLCYTGAGGSYLAYLKPENVEYFNGLKETVTVITPAAACGRHTMVDLPFDVIPLGDAALKLAASQRCGFRYLSEEKECDRVTVQVAAGKTLDATDLWEVLTRRGNTVYVAFDLCSSALNIDQQLYHILAKWWAITPSYADAHLAMIKNSLLTNDRTMASTRVIALDRHIQNVESERVAWVTEYSNRLTRYAEQLDTYRQTRFRATKLAESEERINEQIDIISKLNGIQSIYLDGQNALNIILENQIFMGFPLPPARVRFAFDTKWDLTAYNMTVHAKYLLGHASLSSGQMCFGTGNDKFAQLRVTSNIADMLVMAMNNIRSYSFKTAPFNRIEYMIPTIIKEWVNLGEKKTAEQVAAIWDAVLLEGYPHTVSPSKTTVKKRLGETSKFYNEVGNDIAASTAKKLVKDWVSATGLNPLELAKATVEPAEEL